MIKLKDGCEVQARTGRTKGPGRNLATIFTAILMTCPPAKNTRTSIEVKLSEDKKTGKPKMR